MGVFWKVFVACAIGSAAAFVGAPAAAGDDYLPPKVDTTTPTGVNLADGSFIYTQTDISIGTLSLDRHHLGGLEDPTYPFYGPRMSNNFDIYLMSNAQSGNSYYRYMPIVHIGSSAVGPYQEHIAGTTSTFDPLNSDGYQGVLTKSGSTYTYVSGSGAIYTFNPSVAVRGPFINGPTQRVASIAYPDGRKLTFSYNASSDLKEVTDNNGYAIIFDYNGDHTISAACGFNLSQAYVTSSSTCAGAALKVSYGYTSGLLTSVVDVLNKSTTYQYQGNEISCIMPPTFSTCKIANVYGGYAFK